MSWMEAKMKNLLDETLDALERNGKTPNDILTIFTADYMFSFETFAEAARLLNYNSGFGTQEVNSTLVIVGEDWWLSREEYDGSEWWRFNKKPSLTNQKFVRKLNKMDLEEVLWFGDEEGDEE